MKVVYLLYYGTNLEFVSGNIKAIHEKMSSLTPPDKLLYLKTYFWVIRHLKSTQALTVPMPYMYDFQIKREFVQSKFIK